MNSPSYYSPPAAAQQAINAEVLANMTAIVVLSMIMTPFSVMLFDRYFKESRAAAAVDDVEEHAGELNGNVLIIGFGRMGQVVSQMPLAYGATISILDNDPDIINVAREYGFKVYYGEATRADVLHASGVEHTDIVAVCVDNGESAVRIVENIHHINPNAKGVRARLGQTQCAGPSESGSGFRSARNLLFFHENGR